MKYSFILAIFSIVLFLQPTVQAEVVLQEVEYDHNGQNLVGYLAYDSSVTTKRPGVMIIHDWNGIDDYEKGRAKQLAEMGYVAFAADIYGKGHTAAEPGKAGEWAGKFRNNDREMFRARANRGLEFLKAQEQTDATKVAAIGYCFGGTGVLELARSGTNLNGVISFHGGLNQSAEATPATAMNTRILVCTGADDPGVPIEQVGELEDELRALNADYQIISYGNAVHSFTNPGAGNDKSSGNAYDETADKRSWEHMKVFFAEVLQ
ncbi:MAG: dienelactone hydrolase family protein [Sumerlaeia bacterium]